MSDLISIITPTYDSFYILDTYKSILAQNYKNWEWVITDDKSSNDFISLLKDIEAKDSRIKVYYLDENLGAGSARNNSIKYAKGRYIAPDFR